MRRRSSNCVGAASANRLDSYSVGRVWVWGPFAGPPSIRARRRGPQKITATSVRVPPPASFLPALLQNFNTPSSRGRRPSKSARLRSRWPNAAFTDVPTPPPSSTNGCPAGVDTEVSCRRADHCPARANTSAALVVSVPSMRLYNRVPSNAKPLQQVPLLPWPSSSRLGGTDPPRPFARARHDSNPTLDRPPPTSCVRL